MQRALVVVLFAVGTAIMGCGGDGQGARPDARPIDAGPPIDGAAPDAALASVGAPGTGNVVGGVQAQSPRYKIIGTVSAGEGAGATSSTTHRGGVVGATQAP